MIRHQLGTFCSARSSLNEFYTQFSACANRVWSPLIESELDKILKERINQNNKMAGSAKAEQSSAELTNAELSLIDDIVAHLHEEQVQEIASELALEQHVSVTTTSTTTSTTSTTTTPRPLIMVLEEAPVHHSTGKLAQTDATGLSGGAAAAAASLSVERHQPAALEPKRTEITVVEIEHEPKSSTPAPVKAVAIESSASLQQQMNALSADSIIPQSAAELSKPPSLPLPPKQTTLTLIESSSPPQQVAPVLAAPPPTTSQPHIVIVEQPQPQTISPATLSPVPVVASAAEPSVAPVAAAAVTSSTIQEQPALHNAIVQPHPSAVTASAVAAGQQSAGVLPAQSSELAVLHQQAVNSVVAGIIDTALGANAKPAQEGAVAAASIAAAPAVPQLAASPAAPAQPIGVSHVSVEAAQAPVQPVGPAATTSVAAVTSLPPLEPAIATAAAVATPPVAEHVGIVTSHLLPPVAPPTPAPTNELGTSSLANLMLNSIGLAGTRAPVAEPLGAAAASTAVSAVGAAVANQPAAGVQAAVSATSLPPPVAQPAIAPPLVAAPLPEPHLILPTTVEPPQTVIPAPPLAAASSLPVASASASAAPLPATHAGVLAPVGPIPPAANAAVTSLATAHIPGPPAPMEPAIFKHIDSALDLIGKSSSSGKLSVSVLPAKEDKILSVTKVEVLTTSTTTTAKPEPVKTLQISIVKTDSTSTTTAKPVVAAVSSSVLKKTSSSGNSVVLVESKHTSGPTSKKPLKMKITTTVSPPSTSKKPKPSLPLHRNGERELISLKSKYGKKASVHDVIVVGDHVDGDDRLLDYDDHSDHHDEDEQHDGEHGHHEHEHSKLDHTVSVSKSSAKSGSSRSGSITTKVIKIQHGDKKGDDKSEEAEDSEEDFRHHDHEHLLKGLLAGDVIHVDAGEPDKSSD